jgi:hypothetical protein
LAFGMGGQHQRRTLVVAHLTLAQEHDERASVAVADNVQLGVQTWPGPVHSDDSKTASPMTCSIEEPAAPHAAVAARHVRNASSRKTRSVRRVLLQTSLLTEFRYD